MRPRRHPGQNTRRGRWALVPSLALSTLLLLPARAAEPVKKGTEVHLLPAVNYDTDLGLGLGAMTSIAGVDPQWRPFLWRLSILGYATVKLDPDTGRPQIIQQDHFVRLEMPKIQGGRWRLTTELRMRRQTNTGYYGLGRDAATFRPEDAGRETYVWLFPYLDGVMERRLTTWHGTEVRAFGGARLGYSSTTIAPDSLLARDLARDPSDPRRALLAGTDPHFDAVARLGLVTDARDDEIVPTCGHLASVGARLGAGSREDLLWAEVQADLRGYLALPGVPITLAARAAGSLTLGRPPLYELARIGGLRPYEATGGAMGVRGVRLRRYHGLGNLLGNLEVRAHLVTVHLLGSRLDLRGLLFTDGLVTWADPIRRRIDAPPNTALGVGGGLRLLMGTTFVVRADLGVSPTEGTSGFYLDVGHIF